MAPSSAAVAGAGAEKYPWSFGLVVGLVLAMWIGFGYLESAYLASDGNGGEPLLWDVLISLEAALIPLGIGAAFMRGMGRRWSGYGLGRSQRWGRVVLTALAVSGVAVVFSRQFGPSPLSGLTGAAGSSAAAGLVGIVAVAVAAAEELVLRGFVLNETAGLLGGGRVAWGAAVVLVAGAAAIAHAHHGASGMLGAGGLGLLFGSVYVACGRNLWIVVFAAGTAAGAILALGG